MEPPNQQDISLFCGAMVFTLTVLGASADISLKNL